jgi:hypothetical protein
VRVVLDWPRPEPVSEDTPFLSMPLVQGARMTALDAAHAAAEIRLGRLDDAMVMGVHQAARVDDPAELTRDASVPLYERDSVAMVSHDPPPSVPLSDRVVDRAWSLAAWGTGHDVIVDVAS